uniref:Uncharacterized protein n=1 Tax=Prolemur simus TaxID=1328070 RepID=A0A8C8ZEY1_PROSS
MDTVWQYQFCVILPGDSNVGKLSLLGRYTEGIFVNDITQMVGVNFSVHLWKWTLSSRWIQFWDTVGQEGSETCSYYQNSAGVLLLFDITNRISFESVAWSYWEVLEKVKPFNILILVYRVMPEKGNKLAPSLGIHYVEISAKSNSNISTAFEQLTQEIYEAVKRGLMGPNSEWEGVKCRVLLWAKLQEEEIQSRSRWMRLF